MNMSNEIISTRKKEYWSKIKSALFVGFSLGCGFTILVIYLSSHN